MRWRNRRKPKQEPTPWLGPLPAAPGCDCQVCRPEASYDAHERRTIDTVLQHGWQVTLVADDVPCEDPDHDHGAEGAHEPTTPFAYTVGLGHRAGHPELLMSGLDHGVMHLALNEVARRVVAGSRLAPGDVLEGVLAGVPVVIEQVADEALAETVAWSGWFHRAVPRALVVVWPSTSGLFAWQPGAPDGLDDRQPRAWRAPYHHVGALGTDPEWDFPVPPDRLAFSCKHVVERGDVALFAARQSDEDRGEDWTVHCGAETHDTDEMCLVHLAHLVRAAPSLRQLSDLRLEEEAWRSDVDDPWTRARLS